MKQLLFLATAFVFTLFISSCDSSKCSGDERLSVQPDRNPVGYEVLLKVDGSGSGAKVLFGNLEADTRPGGEAGDIIAKIPSGLSGNVEISVDQSDCIARYPDFVVYASGFPSNVQVSLPQVIVPTPALSVPGSFTNAWVKVGTNGQTIFLQDSLENSNVTTRPFGFQSREFDFTGNGFFHDNPVSGSVNVNTKTVVLNIDRRLKQNGSIEHFVGQFMTPPAELIPATIPADTKISLLLTSQETGRQMLLIPQ